MSTSTTTVDKRVVEMQFKNQDFERGISQTITSLDELKKALDINTKSLDLSRVQKEADKLNLAKVTEAVEQLSNRFSTLGIIGMSVMSNLTNKAIGLVEKIGQLSIGQILTGGKGRAQKVADAKFKLEGLMRDYEDSAERIEKVFGSASNAVTDTAFGLDEAANISAMLVGSGVDYEAMAGDVSDLDIALRGIAGTAAMSNSSFEEIGRIFAQVKTAGRLMGQDMMQLQGRTINVIAELSKYLNKSQAEVKEMVHKGQIDFNTFAAAMDNSFGAQAKKSNETLQGVLANVRASLSRIGEIFYSGIIENKDLIAFFGDLKQWLNDIKASMEVLKEPFAKMISSFAKLGTAILSVFNLGKSTKWNSLVDIAVFVFDKISSFIDALTAKINGFVEATHIDEAVEEVKETVDKISEVSQEIKDIAWDIWFGKNPYGNGQSRVDALGAMYDKVQPYVNAMKQANFDMEKADQIYTQMMVDDANKVAEAKQKEMEARLGLVKVGDQSVENAEKTTEAFSPLFRVLKNIVTGVTTIGNAFKKVFSVNELKKNIGQISLHFGRIIKAFELTEERTGKLETFFVGLFNIFKMVGDVLTTVISSGFGILANILPHIIDGIMTFGEYIGSAITNFREFIESNNLLARAGSFIVYTFTKVVSTLKEFFARFVQLPAVQKLKEEFIDIYERVGAKFLEWFGKAEDAMSDFFGSLDNADGSMMDKILGGINEALETMMGLANDAKGGVGKFIGNFKEGGTLHNYYTELTKVNKGYQMVKKTTDSLAKSGSVGEFVSNMSTAVGGASGGGSGVLNKADEALGKLRDGFNKLDLAKTTLIGLSSALVAASISFSVFTFRITDAIKNFSELPKALTGAFKSVKGALDGVKDYFKRKGTAKIITQVAIAIAVLAASLAALAIVGNKYDLMQPAYAMSMVLGVMTIMIGIIAHLTKSQKSAKKFNEMMEAFSKIILSMSGSLFLLAASMALLSDIKWDKDAWTSLGVLVGLMAVLIGVIAAISKLGPEIKSSGLWLVFYAGSVWLLVSALKRLADLDITDLGDKMKVLAKAMAIVGGIAIASSRMSFGKGLSVLVLIGSIIALELALKWVINHGITQQELQNGLDPLKTALTMLGALAVYMIVVSNLVKKPEGVAAMLVAAIFSLLAVTLALKGLSKIQYGPLWSAVGALSVMMILLAGLIFVIGNFGQGARLKQAGSLMLKLAAVFAIMGIVIAFLGYLDPKVLEQGGEAVAQIVALLIAVVLASHWAGKADYKAIVAMIGMVAMLALLVSLMSFIEDKESLLEAAGIFGLALVAFGTAMYLATKEAKKSSYKSIESMVMAVLVIGGMLIGLMYLSKGDYLLMLSAAGAMALVLLALGRCAQLMVSSFAQKGVGPATMKQINSTIAVMIGIIATIGFFLSLMAVTAQGNWVTLLAAALAMTGILFAMAGVLKVINDQIPGGANDVKKMKKKLESMGLLLIAIGVIGVLLSSIALASGSNWGTLIAAAGSMAGLLLVLTGVYFALSKINADGKTMIAKAGALALMSVALIPVAIALNMLASYNWKNMLGMAAALSLVIVALAGSLALLTVLAKSGGAGIIFGVAAALGVLAILIATSVYIIAKAIKVVVSAINDLAKINYNAIDIVKLNELVGLLLKMSLVSFVTAAGIAAISVALIILGGAILLVSVGAALIFVTATKLINAIDKLLTTFERITKSSNEVAGGVKTISDALVNSIKSIAMGLALGFVIFVQTLSVKARLVGEAIKDFVITVIDVVAEVKTEIERKFIRSLSDFFEMLEDELPSLFEHLNNVILLCLAELALNAGIYGFFGAIIASEFAIGLMAGLAEKADELIDEATFLAISIIKALKDTFDKYKDSIASGVEAGFSEFSAGFWDLLANSPLAPKKFKEWAKQNADFMRDNARVARSGFDDEWARLSEAHAAHNAEKFYGDQEKEIKNYNTSAAQAEAKGKAEAIYNQSATASSAAGETTDSYFNVLGEKIGLNSEQLKGSTKEQLLQMLLHGGQEAIDESVESWDLEAFNKLPENVKKNLENEGWQLNDAGDAMVKSVSTGVEEATNGVTGTGIVDTLKGFVSDAFFGDAGVEGVLGDVPGMFGDNANFSVDSWMGGIDNLVSEENLSKISGYGTTEADTLLNSFNDELGIDSPSKEAIRSAGWWIDGLLITLNSNKNRDALHDAAFREADTIIQAFDSGLDNVNNPFTPTIRPVLETKNMDQFNSIMGVLDNPTTMRLAADSQLRIDNANQFRLADQIEALRTDINKLANTDFEHMMDGVNINVNAETTVDGQVLRKTASAYTIGQIDKRKMGYAMATGGKF